MPAPQHAPTVRQRRIEVMGSTAHVVLIDGSAGALGAATRRLRDLERRWSRFLPDSDVSRLNGSAGTALRVSAETALLVGLAVQGWRRTGGRYDPTLLGAVRAAGYTRSLASPSGVTPMAVDPPPHDPRLCGRIVLDADAGTICLPPGCGFDPGGIGKGLAADLVLADLVSAGAAGACVNVGGDLRVWGRGPHGARWQVGLPGRDGAGLALTDVAVATSSVTERAWSAGGRSQHHLIDPATSRPSRTDIATATVVAPAAWLAEVYALAAILSTADQVVDDLRAWGVDGLVTTGDGRTHTTAAWAASA